jgi:hypothetical protein
MPSFDASVVLSERCRMLGSVRKRTMKSDYGIQLRDLRFQARRVRKDTEVTKLDT